MRKSFLKNRNSTILILCLLMFLASCTPDEKDPIVVFTNIEASKTDAFIEEKIILTLGGTGFTNVNWACSNTSVKITKVTSSIYEIASSVAATANIDFVISNKQGE